MPKQWKNEVFTHGGWKLDDLWWWINERHRIYLLRKQEPDQPPWTQDPVLQKYRFTNVFRQLDRTTQTLNRVLAEDGSDLSRVATLANIWIFRLFGREEHLLEFGTIGGPARPFSKFRKYIERRIREGKPVFCPSVQRNGRPGEIKYKTYLDSAEHIWKGVAEQVDRKIHNSPYARILGQQAFTTINRLGHMTGKFIASEVVADMRFIGINSTTGGRGFTPGPVRSAV